MHAVVAFAKPFRMPDFFLISGLFLAQRHRPRWRTYLDRKVVHFAYFYVLWMTIQFAFKAPGIVAGAAALAGVAQAYLMPSSSRSARCGSSICCRCSSSSQSCCAARRRSRLVLLAAPRSRSRRSKPAGP